MAADNESPTPDTDLPTPGADIPEPDTDLPELHDPGYVDVEWWVQHDHEYNIVMIKHQEMSIEGVEVFHTAMSPEAALEYADALREQAEALLDDGC